VLSLISYHSLIWVLYVVVWEWKWEEIEEITHISETLFGNHDADESMSNSKPAME